MTGEAPGSDFVGDPVFPHRCFEIRLKCLRVSANAAFARGSKLRIRGVGLLHHRSGEARKLRQFAGQDRLAKIDIRKNTIQRIRCKMIRRVGEQIARRRFPMLHRRQGKVIFALEVMEEAALGHAGFGTHILDARCVVSLGPDNFDRRVQKLCLRLMMLHRVSIPISRYGEYRLMGMCQANSLCPAAQRRRRRLTGSCRTPSAGFLPGQIGIHRISTVGNCGSPLMQ